MDTTHASPSSTATTNAPRAEGRATGAQLPDELRLGIARLIVTDLDRATPFYEDVIGLTRLDDPVATTDAEPVARFGTADGTTVLELVERSRARRAGRHAGLYHVALLYPSREELARAVQRIAASRTMIDGASDHGTHEAIYLPDPDGNGLELAADRPREAWPNLADIEEIRPRPLDLHDLLATLDGEDTVPTRAADGLAVGHVHLHVGDIPQAVRFYVDVVGFETITAIPVAGFVSAGGYHHHLAFNTWKGVGVGPAPVDSVGLAFWTAHVPTAVDLDELEARLTAADAAVSREADGTVVLRDPWGIELRVMLDPR